MWKFIITWCVLSRVSTPCYETDSQIITTKYCYKIVVNCKHKAEFFSKDSVDYFLSSLKVQGKGEFPKQEIGTLQTDSIFINQPSKK